MSPSSPWYWEPDEPRQFDLELANQILDDAGYEDTDGDGVREMPGGGEPLELEVFAASSVPSAPPSAKLIASWLAEIGIEVETLDVVSDGIDACTVLGLEESRAFTKRGREIPRAGGHAAQLVE